MGEELDVASTHDFLDPYLTVLVLGGTLDNTPTNSIHNGACRFYHYFLEKKIIFWKKI